MALDTRTMEIRGNHYLFENPYLLENGFSLSVMTRTPINSHFILVSDVGDTRK